MSYCRIVKLNMLLLCWSLLGLIAWVSESFAENLPNISSELTPASSEIHNLHLVILWICVITAVAVFSAMIYSIYSHRKSQDGTAENFHKKSSTEFIWTVIPFAIVVLMAIPAAKTLLYTETVQISEIRIKVTREDCRWRYDYLDHDISFSSNQVTDTHADSAVGHDLGLGSLKVDNPVVLPIQTKIHLMFSSIDRAYFWSVAELDVKQDAIPERTNDYWVEIKTPGVYRGHSGDGCGPEHGSMPIVVVATTALEYNKWLSKQQAARATADQSERR